MRRRFCRSSMWPADLNDTGCQIVDTQLQFALSRTIWCLDVYGSASTWTFNAVRLLHTAAGVTVRTHFIYKIWVLTYSPDCETISSNRTRSGIFRLPPSWKRMRASFSSRSVTRSNVGPASPLESLRMRRVADPHATIDEHLNVIPEQYLRISPYIVFGPFNPYLDSFNQKIDLVSGKGRSDTMNLELEAVERHRYFAR